MVLGVHGTVAVAQLIMVIVQLATLMGVSVTQAGKEYHAVKNAPLGNMDLTVQDGKIICDLAQCTHYMV